LRRGRPRSERWYSRRSLRNKEKTCLLIKAKLTLQTRSVYAIRKNDSLDQLDSEPLEFGSQLCVAHVGETVKFASS
jgi:hypothetical protein